MEDVEILIGGISEITSIRPYWGWSGVNLRELWRYRELVYFLIWHDVKVRTSRPRLVLPGPSCSRSDDGGLQRVLQPVIGVPNGWQPIPHLLLCGALALAVGRGGRQQGGQQSGRRPEPGDQGVLSAPGHPAGPQVLAGLVDFALAFVVYLGMVLYYQVHISWQIVSLPLFLGVALITALGSRVSLALNVSYRDVGYVIPFLVRVWFLLTPITYAVSVVPRRLQPLYWHDPWSASWKAFRWALSAGGEYPWPLMGISALTAVLMLVSGSIFFRRMERTFADLVWRGLLERRVWPGGEVRPE